jgi:ABC-type nitrate/sulfonate/bicarbonate transport system substrate-binding protein
MQVLLRGAVFLSLLLAMFAPDIQAQSSGARKIPIKIIYSALTASNAPVWVAGDQGLYEKYGLDVPIVHGRGASPIQALARGHGGLATSPGRRSSRPISRAAI